MDNKLNDAISTAVADAMAPANLPKLDWYQVCPPDIQRTIRSLMADGTVLPDAAMEAVLTLAGMLKFIELAGANGG